MVDALANALRIAASKTERNPTDAQKEAGNYAKGKLRWNGLEIAIENPKGGERSGVDKGGKRWSVKMPAHYGYVLGSEGKDGDHVDVYLGPDGDAGKVFVVDQVDAASGRFDEHKCMLCYRSKASALADYEKAFSDGKARDRIGSVTEMSVEAFKDWLRHEDTKKPLGGGRKGYAAGGAIMPRMPYADGGAPDWRSDMDVEGGIPLGGPRRQRKPDILREAPSSLDKVLDYGSIPAKVALDIAEAPGLALGEAIEDPSLANITNAGVQGALAFSPLRPLQAGKAALAAAGLGFGTAASRDSGLLPFGEARAEGGLNPDQQKRLERLQRKRSLSRAEREEQNTLMAIQARFQELEARNRFEAQARRDAALIEAEKRREKIEAEAGAKKREDERREFNESVDRAEKVRAEELGKYTPFKDTEVGKVYDKLGILAPAMGAMGAGFLSRTAGRLGGKSGLMTETVSPAITGAGTAGMMANWPLGHEVVFSPSENPERRAYEGYARELPQSHPRKQEWQDYARGLPAENPARRVAVDEFYDPIKAAERTGFGVAEGLVSGVAGAHASKLMEKMPGVVARTPGALAREAYESLDEAAAARNKLLTTRNSPSGGSGEAASRIEPALPGHPRLSPAPEPPESGLAQGIAEARRRSGAPGATAGLEPAAARPRPPRSSEASPSRPAFDPPPSDTTVKRSAEKVKKQDTPPKKAPPDAKAIREELAAGLRRIPEGDPRSAWGRLPVGLSDLDEAPEVIMLTRDKLGRKQFRTPEGRYRGGPVERKSLMGRALDVARKFARGGAVTVGPVVGETGGREDAKPVDVPAGAYVIPADCVSAAGQGNTLSGMEHLKKIFGEPVTRAAGGAVGILISDGEYVLTPEQVEKIGNGDMKKGHQVLDQLVRKLRTQHIDTLKSLPPPAKG